MTLEEFSNGFDTLVNSYRRFRSFDNQEASDSIEFDEYEKSLYLTKAQEELVLSLYNGRNPYGDSFESTEEMRRHLDARVKHQGKQPFIPTGINPLETTSVFFQLPEDVWFIVFEEVRLRNDIDGCKAGTKIGVVPVRHDEYNRIKKNPFRGANERRALRLDAKDNVVEIVCDYPIDRYFFRYIKKLNPIVLENLPNGLTVNKKNTATDCELHEALHQRILELAVMMGLRSKGYQYRREKEE